MRRRKPAVANQALAVKLLQGVAQDPTSAFAAELLSELVTCFSVSKDEKAKALLKFIWQTNREVFGLVSQMKDEIAKIKSETDKPKPLDTSHAPALQGNTAWRSKTRQVPMSDLPPAIQEQIDNLYKRTADPEGRERWEWASIAVELGDGTIIAPKREATSREKNNVMGWITVATAVRDTLPRTLKELKEKPKAGDRPVRVYYMHTHPQERQQAATDVHADGRYYTLLSEQDYRSTDIDIAPLIEKHLRNLGFTGTIEIIQGAIPVPLRPVGNLNEKLYINTYTTQQPAVPQTLR